MDLPHASHRNMILSCNKDYTQILLRDIQSNYNEIDAIVIKSLSKLL